MKWGMAGFIVLLAALAGVGYSGWQTISQLETETASLTSEVAALQAEQDATNALLAEQLATPATTDPALNDALRNLDGLRLDLEQLRQELGTRPLPITSQTLWETVDGLYEILSTLITTAPPPVAAETPAPGLPDAQWCAQYLLALETAGLNRAQAQGQSNMNFANYHDWVVLPMVEIGCPDPNE